MIKIQIEMAREAASQFNYQRAVLSNKKERIACLANEIAGQFYAEETAQWLKVLEKELEEAEDGLKQLEEGLIDICQILERTEEKVVKVYNEETSAQLGTVTQQMKVCLNPNLQRIVPVCLRSEDEMYE